MKVISVNIGQPTAVHVGNRMSVSGIRKHPVPGRVNVTASGLDGDHVHDRKHHGGVDQAVYVYTREDYDHWNDLLGRTLEPGTFGENVLISGLESAGVGIGERFRMGHALLEVTAARIPCGTLGARMEDAGFVKRFARERRPGFYARVLEPGDVGRGDDVTREAALAGAPTVADVFDLWFAGERDRETLERLLTYPVAVRLRADIEEWLAKLER